MSERSRLRYKRRYGRTLRSTAAILLVAAALVGLGLCLAVAGLAMGGRFSDLRNLHLDPATGQWEQTEEKREQTDAYTGSGYY